MEFMCYITMAGRPPEDRQWESITYEFHLCWQL